MQVMRINSIYTQNAKKPPMQIVKAGIITHPYINSFSFSPNTPAHHSIPIVIHHGGIDKI